MNAHELKDAIARVKTLTDLLPDPILRTATETGLDLLAGALGLMSGSSLTVEEFRAQVAEGLRTGWQSAIDAKFGAELDAKFGADSPKADDPEP